MSLVILGVGVLAFVEAQQSFVDANSWSTHAATGTFLCNELREFTRRFPRHDRVTGLFFQGSGASAVLTGWGRETGEVAVSDLDDLDDLDGLRFGVDGDFAGPINAFGDVIFDLDANGNPDMDEESRVPLRGWFQQIIVEKVDPSDNATVRADNYWVPAVGGVPARNVDRFPLRVTIIAEYQGPYDAEAREISRVSWIVPP
ncbi:MAG: hypothetical protein SFZ23_01610 [Planctomycetota bacterium]|nr:hypothetical protein [Planctomycetota bacterium]